MNSVFHGVNYEGAEHKLRGGDRICFDKEASIP